MLHEFAVDPTCMPTLDALHRVTDHCAFHLGRFISDFARRRWMIEVLDAISPRSFLAKQRVMDLLVELERRGGLIDTGRKYKPELPYWIDNALEQHALKPFRAIVVSANATNRESLLTVDEILPSSAGWHVETEDRIPRTSESLAACVRPLLHRSHEILLVDPHFSPDKARYQQSLQVFIAAAHEAGRRYRRFEYHTKVQTDRQADPMQRKIWIDQFRSSCTTKLAMRVVRGLTLRIVLWEEIEGGDEMHARFVMTERGAIRIDKGLDLGDPGQTTDICLVPPSVYRSRWNDLEPGATTYRHIETIQIVGTRTA